MNENPLRKAKYAQSAPDGTARCLLCPRNCVIKEGGYGYCGVRTNLGGGLFTRSYGCPVALQIDPVEKKPLRHFLPGTRTFSIGTLGCNLKCLFCQNHHLSRAMYQERLSYRFHSPEEMVQLVLRHGCESISFTYNEPTVFAEYAEECAILAREKGLKTILVSNGVIAPKPREELYPLMDAANFDVKGFSEEYYSSMCGGRLEWVTESVEYFKNVRGGHAELTYLVIPGKNDSLSMVDAYLDWVEAKLGKKTPLHFTAYHPDYLYSESPRTPLAMLESLQNYAKETRSFPNVYLGNIC